MTGQEIFWTFTGVLSLFNFIILIFGLRYKRVESVFENWLTIVGSNRLEFDDDFAGWQRICEGLYKAGIHRLYWQFEWLELVRRVEFRIGKPLFGKWQEDQLQVVEWLQDFHPTDRGKFPSFEEKLRMFKFPDDPK
jgi:hypothetical protein